MLVSNILRQEMACWDDIRALKVAVITKNWKLIIKLIYCEFTVGPSENHFNLGYFNFSNDTMSNFSWTCKWCLCPIWSHRKLDQFDSWGLLNNILERWPPPETTGSIEKTNRIFLENGNIIFLIKGSNGKTKNYLF